MEVERKAEWLLVSDAAERLGKIKVLYQYAQLKRNFNRVLEPELDSKRLKMTDS